METKERIKYLADKISKSNTEDLDILDYLLRAKERLEISKNRFEITIKKERI